MLRSLPRSSIRTRHAKIAEHAQSFCHCVRLRGTPLQTDFPSRFRLYGQSGKKTHKPVVFSFITQPDCFLSQKNTFKSNRFDYGRNINPASLEIFKVRRKAFAFLGFFLHCIQRSWPGYYLYNSLSWLQLSDQFTCSVYILGIYCCFVSPRRDVTGIGNVL